VRTGADDNGLRTSDFAIGVLVALTMMLILRAVARSLG
jgi:hypothetical protein